MITTRIEHFVGSVQKWLAKLAVEINNIENNGREGNTRWKEIVLFVNEAIMVVTAVYDRQYEILDSEGNPTYNYLHDWTDAEIGKLMSDFAFRWGVNIVPSSPGAYPTLILTNETIKITEGGSFFEFPTVFDMGEI